MRPINQRASDQTYRKVRIFCASPGDVGEERDRLQQVVQELDRQLGDALGITLELKRWETHTFPAMGRPQGVVNKQIGPHDIFVGIMWRRFGRPTGEADSGTEEEFRRAYATWERDSSPHIMFYFRESLQPNTSETPEQVEKVLAFKQELMNKGLIGEYSDPHDFERTIRDHLHRLLMEEYGSHLQTNEEHARPSQPEANSAISETDSTSSHPGRSMPNVFIPKVQREFTDREVRSFLRQAFDTVHSYFEKAVGALSDRYDHLHIDVEKLDGRTFLAELFEHGNHRQQCKIWLGGMQSTGQDSIAYVEGRHVGTRNTNTLNDYVSVDRNGEELALQLSPMSRFNQMRMDNPHDDKALSPDQAAEYFWRRFIRVLDRGR